MKQIHPLQARPQPSAAALLLVVILFAVFCATAWAMEYTAVFTAPPVKTPCNSAVDGPLLGNGSLLAALAGPPENLRFHLNLNDLWMLNNGGGSPKPLAVLSLAMPAMKGASYRVEQDLRHALTAGTFKKNSVTLHFDCAVAATASLLWIRLSAEGGVVDGLLALNLPLPLPGEAPQPYEMARHPSREGADLGGGAQTVWRFFDKEVRIKTGAACAARVLGGGSSFTVSPGKPVWIVAVTSSLFHAKDPLADALQTIGVVDEQSLKNTLARHEAWWRDFWSASFVDIPDKVIEQRYYLSQYVLASASRDSEFPPGLFGWVTSDYSRWGGNYYLNYNFVASFYGLYAANHVKQADPCNYPFFHVAERTAQDPGVRTPGVAGLYQCRVIAPLGCFNAAGRAFAPPPKSPEQKSNGAYSCVPLALRWYATYDLDYAKQAYPYVKGVAEFWKNWLKFENGQYNDYHDPVHEESGEDVNPIVSLALCRMVMTLALDMSRELGVDAGQREKWAHVRDHLAPYPTCAVRDLPEKFRPAHLPTNDATLNLPLFRYTERGTPWWQNNTVGIQHIFPAGGIGLDSPSEQLERARNQIRVMNRWVDFNGMNSFYAAAARVGYDPQIILKEMHGMVQTIGGPNGLIPSNPAGMENLSIVPNAIQEMLMQSHEGVIRFFPCWPVDQDARFGTLRARGAFLVSAALKEGVVTGVTIISEKGQPCAVQNPWPGKAIRVIRDGHPGELLASGRFNFKTKPGETVELQPQSQP